MIYLAYEYNPEEKWKYVKGGSSAPRTGVLRRVHSLSRNANESLLVGSFYGFPIESCFVYEEDIDNEHIDSHQKKNEIVKKSKETLE